MSKLVGHFFPGLVTSTRYSERQEAAEAPEKDEKEKPISATFSSPRGLAIYLEPDVPITAVKGTPWQTCLLTLPEIGGRAHVAFVGGTMVEARTLAREIVACSGRHVKQKTVTIRRLFHPSTDDLKELIYAKDDFDGFLVPADESHDMAKAFEKTRRRALALIDKSLMNGWTKAPFIALESPSPDFSERIPPDLCDYLVVESPVQGARFASKRVVVKVKPGEAPWWITSSNYLYSITGNTLWWTDWMMNPLTSVAKRE